MRRLPIVALLVAVAYSPAIAQQPTVRTATQRPAAPAMSTAQRYENAYYLWDAGKFDTALVEFKRVLTAPDAAAFHDRIAEVTGEVWTTSLVAENAAAPVWSLDGRMLAYTTGVGAARRVGVRRSDDVSAAPLMDQLGYSPVFAADGRTMVWQSQAATAGFNIAQLPSGAPRRVNVDAPAVTQVTAVGGTNVTIYMIVGTTGDSTARVLAHNLRDGTWSTVSTGGLQPVTLVRSPDGQRLLVTLGARGAFARQLPGFAAVATSTGSIAEITGTTMSDAVRGESPVWSADGRAFAWTEVKDGATWIRVKRGDGAPTTAASIEGRFQNLALSPNGSTVVYGTMLREDWELFRAASIGGSAGVRITREIQHDHSPRFVNDSLLIAAMGEGRHQRSYLYNLNRGTRTRLHHNNTVRTVAPEYEWSVSPDGSRVAIVTERDGDTVTPHRHLWMMNLTQKTTRAQLVARVDTSLAAERALRANSRRIFAPIAAQVSAAVAEVNIGRIYDYQKQLFAFDSKHITQDGNMPATEWLERTYRSFGYETRLQKFTTVATREIEVANVIATIPGTVNPELVYVVGAHFDSRAEGPGADDNTSGTAMILEAARVLAKRPMPATVMFVAFTGEEAGLRGAREFGRRMKDSITVVGALNNDMMGWSNDHRLDNTIRYSNPGLRDVQHAAALGFSDLILYDAFYYKSTDAQALFDAWGDIIAGIGSYPILGNPHYHQTHDVLETINHRQLTETSKTTVATIMLMASSPSRLTALIAQGNTVTWNAARETGVVRYIVRYGPPENPMQFSASVTNPRATISALRAGWHVAVKAVNSRGLEGWDWARAMVK